MILPNTPNPFEPDKPRFGPLRVLCADDTPVCRKLITNVLEKEGHLVIQAVDGQQALDMVTVKPEAYDVLVTDHNMPCLDGIGLVKGLRERDFAGGIIVVSAGLSEDDAAVYRSMGVRMILPKPLNIEALRSAVKALGK